MVKCYCIHNLLAPIMSCIVGEGDHEWVSDWVYDWVLDRLQEKLRCECQVQRVFHVVGERDST